MAFRFDIGVLRAIAVLSVLFFHFRIPFFEGGFIGVDVFFVISGFLMTKIILSGFERKSFSILGFYKKRVQRIIPALLVISLFILVVSVFLFFKTDFKQNVRNVIVSILFISNIFYWSYSGYFDPSSQNNIFLHSWSLSVEWQFYMIYPIMLLFFKYISRNRNIFKMLLILITIGSFIFCSLYVYIDQDFSFYMIPSRAWEMLLGGLAFIYADTFSKKTNDRSKKIITTISYFVILFGMFFLNENYIWPSAYALIPTLPTFLILMCNQEYPILKNKILQFFGNISYSLYLWHWPIFIIFKYFGFIDPLSIIFMILISVLFSYLTYRYVEINKRLIKPSLTFIAGAVLLGFAFMVYKGSNSVIINNLKVYPQKLNSIGNFSFDYAKNHRLQQYNACNCFLTSNADYTIYNKEKCFRIQEDKKNILLLGDSHAAQFSSSFRRLLPTDYNLLEVSAGFTMPFQNPRGRKESANLINKMYKEFLPENYEKLDLVLISVHWLAHNSANLSYSREELKENILQTIEYFEKLGIPALIIGQSEVYEIEYPRLIVINKLFGRNSEEFINEHALDVNNYLKSFIPSEKFIDIYQVKKVQHFDEGNSMPYMMDNNHYTLYGADQIANLIISKFDDRFFN